MVSAVELSMTATMPMRFACIRCGKAGAGAENAATISGAMAGAAFVTIGPAAATLVVVPDGGRHAGRCALCFAGPRA